MEKNTSCSGSLYELLSLPRGSVEGIEENFTGLKEKMEPKAVEQDSGDNREFEKVRHAFTVLSDPGKKKLYDDLGSAGMSLFNFSVAFHIKNLNRIFLYAMSALQLLIPLFIVIFFILFIADAPASMTQAQWANAAIGVYALYIALIGVWVIGLVAYGVYVKCTDKLPHLPLLSLKLETRILYPMFLLTPLFIYLYTVPFLFLRRMGHRCTKGAFPQIREKYFPLFVGLVVSGVVSIVLFIMYFVYAFAIVTTAALSSNPFALMSFQIVQLVLFLAAFIALEIKSQLRATTTEKLWASVPYAVLFVYAFLKAMLTGAALQSASGIAASSSSRALIVVTDLLLFLFVFVYQLQLLVRFILLKCLGPNTSQIEQNANKEKNLEIKEMKPFDMKDNM